MVDLCAHFLLDVLQFLICIPFAHYLEDFSHKEFLHEADENRLRVQSEIDKLTALLYGVQGITLTRILVIFLLIIPRTRCL